MIKETFLSRLLRASDDLNAVVAVAVDVAAAVAVATAGWFTGFMSSLQRCQFLKALSYFFPRYPCCAF